MCLEIYEKLFKNLKWINLFSEIRVWMKFYDVKKMWNSTGAIEQLYRRKEKKKLRREESVNSIKVNEGKEKQVKVK